MSYILALFLPGVAVMVEGKVGTGLLLLLLQLTFIGWIPACFVAFAIINEQHRRHDAARSNKPSKYTRDVQRYLRNHR